MKVKAGFTIRQVIELTGVTEFTLRGWENRYSALEPHRTGSGRRLYTQQDILKVKTLKDLVDRGHRISKIASLNLPELQKLIEDRELLSSVPKSIAEPENFEYIVKLADQFKWDELSEVMTQKRKKLKPLNFINSFVIPLVMEMSYQVDKGSLSIAQEHILSAMIKENLGLVRSQSVRLKSRSKTKIVFATPEGDLHEIGLLIASSMAAVKGAHILYLGPMMPQRDLCEACIRYQATHVLVVSTVSRQEGAKTEFLEYLNFLDRHLVKKTVLWAAGRSAASLNLSLRRDFKVLGSFSDLENSLDEVLKT